MEIKLGIIINTYDMKDITLVSDLYHFALFIKKLTVMFWRITLRFHSLNFKALDNLWATGFKRYFRVNFV